MQLARLDLLLCAALFTAFYSTAQNFSSSKFQVIDPRTEPRPTGSAVLTMQEITELREQENAAMEVERVEVGKIKALKQLQAGTETNSPAGKEIFRKIKESGNLIEISRCEREVIARRLKATGQRSGSVHISSNGKTSYGITSSIFVRETNRVEQAKP
jgi:rRNA maturation endonuclease Nob1